MPATLEGRPLARRAERPARAVERARPAARFEIRCGDCGYGGVVSRLPARCPMCGGSSWSRTGYGSAEARDR
jgi:rubrerythrin